jgi:hypothetical protein
MTRLSQMNSLETRRIVGSLGRRWCLVQTPRQAHARRLMALHRQRFRHPDTGYVRTLCLVTNNTNVSRAMQRIKNSATCLSAAAAACTPLRSGSGINGLRALAAALVFCTEFRYC